MQLYTQDCETFRTVVKMLVAKEPRLDELLHASLDKNLLEIQQRCLDDLRHFIKELDQVGGGVGWGGRVRGAGLCWADSGGCHPDILQSQTGGC